MRVARALDKLQGLLKRRGVTTSSATLSVVLSANAVQAAPVGLAVTISTAAALAGTTLATATATATKAIAMTILQNTLLTATVAVLAGTGIYEARQASHWRNRIQTLQQQQAPLVEQIQRLQSERDEAARQLASLREDNERLNHNSSELLKLSHIVHRRGTGRAGGCRKQPPAETKDDGRRVVHRASGGGASASVAVVEGHRVVMPGLQKAS